MQHAVPVKSATDDLTPTEVELWQGLGRVVHSLPRRVDADMLRATGLSMTDYAMLSTLAAAEDHRLRLIDLAGRTGLSASRVSRVVDDLERAGTVRKERSAADARATVAILTSVGLEQQQGAALQHAAIARRFVLSLVEPAELEIVARALGRIAEGR